jgi:hypothetical protein
VSFVPLEITIPITHYGKNRKHLENVEYSKYLCNVITSNARYTREIKRRIAMAKAALYSKKALFKGKLDLNLRKKLLSFYICSIVFYGAENSERISEISVNFGTWCWKRMGKIS